MGGGDGSLEPETRGEGSPMSDREYPVYLGLAALAVSAAITVGSGAQLPEALAAPSAPSAPTTDDYGYVDSSARCDDTQTLMAYGRTPRALVVICVNRDGQLEYRGVRISDQAGLTMTATRSPDGTIVATNDGVTYAVSPAMLLVSEGDAVLYRDSWTEFRLPRFTQPSTSSTSTTTATSTATAPTTTTAPTTASGTTAPATVSTTTVTMKPTATAPSS